MQTTTTRTRYYYVYEDGADSIPTVMDEYQLYSRLNYSPELFYIEVLDTNEIEEIEREDWNNPASSMHY